MMAAVDRRFRAIFGLSLVIHAVALALVRVREQRPAALPTILASLRLVAAPPSGSAAVPLPAPAVFPRQARQLPPRREQRPARPVAEAAVPRVPPRTAAEPPAIPAPLPAVVSQATPQVADALAAPLPAQGSLLHAYRQHLTELFAGQQQYPRIAAQRGWEGEVRLRLQVARRGNLVSVRVDRSSGFEVLDQHALAMLERFASLPPLPEGLEASEIQVVVPVNYKLRKAT